MMGKWTATVGPVQRWRVNFYMGGRIMGHRLVSSEEEAYSIANEIIDLNNEEDLK